MTGLLPLRVASTSLLTVACLAGFWAFTWPLFVPASAVVDPTGQAPFLFALVVAAVLLLALVQLTSGGIDAKALAMLGMLAALGALARPLGAGVAGLELVFFVLLLGARVFGPGFGFLLGATTLLASALVTGGVGPWLPYQMLGAAFFGLGAGLLPPARGRAEIALLAAFGSVASFGYGWLTDLAFWPFALGGGTQASFVPGAPVLENLHRFVVFNAATSMGWNLGRAVATVTCTVVLGPPLLRVLRRAARRGHFAATL